MIQKKKKTTFSKLYFFNHSLLPSSIYQGIQAGHAAVELLRKHTGDINPDSSPAQSKQVKEWADNSKTFVLLNGGITADLVRVKRLVKKSGLPWAEFREPDMGNMVTSVAVLVPDDFSAMSGYGNGRNFALYDLLKGSKIAK